MYSNLSNKVDRVPEKFLKYLSGTDGIYEIRVECDSNIYRIFCCFDKGNLVILFNAFQKKSQKEWYSGCFFFDKYSGCYRHDFCFIFARKKEKNIDLRETIQNMILRKKYCSFQKSFPCRHHLQIWYFTTIKMLVKYDIYTCNFIFVDSLFG